MSLLEEQQTVELLKSIGDLTRLRIIKLLLSSCNNMCVNAISKKLNISQPVISQHLKVLKQAKILKSNKEGYFVHYQVNLDALSSLSNDLKNLLTLPKSKTQSNRCHKARS